jgi:trimeric autotransporter adhesin
VIAPSGAVAGAVNVTTLTVTTTNGTYTSTVPAAAVTTDSTTVIAGNLKLVKEQALDAACDGSGSAWTQAALSSAPGKCIMYRITVTNVGAADATGVTVSDATPTYTTISTLAATSSGSIAGPAVGASGGITAYVGTGATSSAGGTIAAGQSAVVTFGVKIAP